jgi:hypothetical protein
VISHRPIYYLNRKSEAQPLLCSETCLVLPPRQHQETTANCLLYEYYGIPASHIDPIVVVKMRLLTTSDVAAT